MVLAIVARYELLSFRLLSSKFAQCLSNFLKESRCVDYEGESKSTKENCKELID